MADDRPRKVERFETRHGGIRIITTVTTVHDPAAVKAAQEFQVRCLPGACRRSWRAWQRRHLGLMYPLRARGGSPLKDDNQPSEALLRVSRPVSEIIWRSVTTHTPEEDAELLRRVEEQRRIRVAIQARPVSGPVPLPSGSPDSGNQDEQ